MNRKDIFLKTRYSELIKGKKLNKACRDIVFEACKLDVLDIPLNMLSSGIFDEKQMESLLNLYKSDIKIWSVYKKQYNQLISCSYTGEQMACVIKAMEKGIDPEYIDFMLSLDKDKDFNAGQMHELYECFVCDIPFEVIKKFVMHDVTAQRIESTRNVLVENLDEDIFDYWKLDDDIYFVICRALLLGANSADIDNTLLLTENHMNADAILSGSIDGLSVEQINDLISKECTAPKIIALIETYKEYYTDEYCSKLKEIDNDIFESIMNDYDGKEGFEEFLKNLNLKFIRTYDVFKSVHGDDECETIAVDTMKSYSNELNSAIKEIMIPEFDEISLLIRGDNYINEIITEYIGIKENFAYLILNTISNPILSYEYMKSDIVDYDKLLGDALLKQNPLIKHYKEVSEKLYKYTQIENVKSELSLCKENQNRVVFVNNDNTVHLHIIKIADNFKLEKIELTLGDFNKTFEAKVAESFVIMKKQLLKNEKTNENKQVKKEKDIVR